LKGTHDILGACLVQGNIFHRYFLFFTNNYKNVKLFHLLLSKSLKTGNKAEKKPFFQLLVKIESKPFSQTSPFSHLSSLCLLLLFPFLVGNKASVVGKSDRS